MKWTTPTGLQAQVHKLWDRGLLLASVAGGESVFPRRLGLKGPDSRALGERFSEVRDWIEAEMRRLDPDAYPPADKA